MQNKQVSSSQFTGKQFFSAPQSMAKICQKNSDYNSEAHHLIYKCVNGGSEGIVPAQFSLENQRTRAWLVVSKWSSKAVLPPALEIGKRREEGSTHRDCLFAPSPSGILSFMQANLTNYKTHLLFGMSLSLLSSLSPSYHSHSNTPLTLPFLPFSSSCAFLVLSFLSSPLFHFTLLPLLKLRPTPTAFLSHLKGPIIACFLCLLPFSSSTVESSQCLRDSANCQGYI